MSLPCVPGRAVRFAALLAGATLLAGCSGPDPADSSATPTVGASSPTVEGPATSSGTSAAPRTSDGPADPVNYVAFGDSYASGYGGGPLLDACGRTGQGYPALLDARDSVELEADVSCAGATALTTDPAAPEGPVDLPAQIADAANRGVLTAETDVVTVTIGGNDVRFGSVVAACAGTTLPATCAPAVQQSQMYAADVLAPTLASQFEQISALAPNATLVVTGYPHLFEPGTAGPLSAAAVDLFNSGTDALNSVIAGQVPDGAVYVDVVDEFAGHGSGTADSWIRLDGGPFDLHPTETGYREGYTAAILADTGNIF